MEILGRFRFSHMRTEMPCPVFSLREQHRKLSHEMSALLHAEWLHDEIIMTPNTAQRVPHLNVGSPESAHPEVPRRLVQIATSPECGSSDHHPIDVVISKGMNNFLGRVEITVTNQRNIFKMLFQISDLLPIRTATKVVFRGSSMHCQRGRSSLLDDPGNLRRICTFASTTRGGFWLSQELANTLLPTR